MLHSVAYELALTQWQDICWILKALLYMCCQAVHALALQTFKVLANQDSISSMHTQCMPDFMRFVAASNLTNLHANMLSDMS